MKLIKDKEKTIFNEDLPDDESVDSVVTTVEEKEAEDLLKEYFGDIEFQTYYPEYKCLCTREYVSGILISLGEKELRDIIEKEGSIKVDCQFCDKKYIFTEEDVDLLFNK